MLKILTRYFGWLDLLLIAVLTLSLTFCKGSPGVIKPQAKYQSSLASGIEFSRAGSPQFIKKMIGLAGPENWGRWSDQNVVILEFAQALPPKFVIELQAKGFGPNINQDAKLVVGNSSQKIRLTAQPTVFTIPIENWEVNIDSLNAIQIIPPAPTSPHMLDPANPDTRKLGVGLISLKILTK